MATPHVIRLRAPWDVQLVGAGDAPAAQPTADPPSPARKIDGPHNALDALGADYRGWIHCTRRFNCPTNIDARERVWLVCEGVRHRGRVLLNDRPLFDLAGDGSFVDHDVTAQLGPRNTLLFELESSGAAPSSGVSSDGGTPGEVRLEIRPVD